MPEASKEEHEGDNSEGFNTAVFPAVIAPISGSNDTPVLFFVWFHVILLTQTNENSNIAIWIKSGHCFV
jgi:hypothetical protein